MRLAYTMLPGRGDGGLMFSQLAEWLMTRGMRVTGLVQADTTGLDRHPCDMDLRVLPDGGVIRISQSLGAGSRGCRLDAGALECAAVEVSRTLSGGVDLLIVNKFGKLEAQGRGFANVIADALGEEIRVIVGVNDLNLEAFLDFTAGLATPLAPCREPLLAWATRMHQAVTVERAYHKMLKAPFADQVIRENRRTWLLAPIVDRDRDVVADQIADRANDAGLKTSR